MDRYAEKLSSSTGKRFANRVAIVQQSRHGLRVVAGSVSEPMVLPALAFEDLADKRAYVRGMHRTPPEYSMHCINEYYQNYVQDTIWRGILLHMAWADTEGVELSFGEWLAAELRGHGWTQALFAEHVSVSPSTVSSWVNDVQPPSRLNCVEIASVLQWPLAEVMKRAGHDPSKAPQLQRQAPNRVVKRALHVVFVPVAVATLNSGKSSPMAQNSPIPLLEDYVRGNEDPGLVLADDSGLRHRGIEEGDIVILDRAAIPGDGDVVFVRVLNERGAEEYLLREWWDDGDYVLLRTALPGMPPLRLDPSDVIVVGTARRRLRIDEV